MLIHKNGNDTSHVFDWITPVNTVESFRRTMQDPVRKLCIVQNEDTLDIWSCSSDKDAVYDLRRYYKMAYSLDFDQLDHFFFKARFFQFKT